jgi:hypothetical protein
LTYYDRAENRIAAPPDPALSGATANAPGGEHEASRRIHQAAQPEQAPAGETAHLTVNLHARDDFDKGDIGRVIGHRVSKATEAETRKGSNLVTALQEVKAGTNGWFEVR